jgi:hypothetical protein
VYKVYVQAFPDGHGRRQISNGGGQLPAWSRNGRDLFFKNNRVLMAASYRVRGDSVVSETPRVWFDKRIANFPSTMSYNPAPDGKRMVALLPADTLEESRGRVILLLNFFDELQRRVPTRGE